MHKQGVLPSWYEVGAKSTSLLKREKYATFLRDKPEKQVWLRLRKGQANNQEKL
jgi:hypothetical protein